MLRFGRSLLQYLNARPVAALAEYSLSVGGRAIGIAEYGVGPSDAQLTVLYFHGTPACRLEPGVHTSAQGEESCAYESERVRLVCVERPGFGLSSPVPASFSVADFAAEVARMLEQHEARLRMPARFSVLGFSAGAPYALAMGALLPDRVETTVVVAGVVDSKIVPLTARRRVEEFFMRSSVPLQTLVYRAATEAIKLDLRASMLIFDGIQRIFGRNRALSHMTQKRFRIYEMLLESTRAHGYASIVQDTLRHQSISSDWGFDVRRLRGRRVMLYYSREDWTVAPADGEALALCTDAPLVWLGGGHLCFYFHLPRILADMKREHGIA